VDTPAGVGGHAVGALALGKNPQSTESCPTPPSKTKKKVANPDENVPMVARPPTTFRHVTGKVASTPSGEAVMCTLPVGFSPDGPLRASKSKPRVGPDRGKPMV
jgi:hypothetical protein